MTRDRSRKVQYPHLPDLPILPKRVYCTDLEYQNAEEQIRKARIDRLVLLLKLRASGYTYVATDRKRKHITTVIRETRSLLDSFSARYASDLATDQEC